jgi:hypothetical protein
MSWTIHRRHLFTGAGAVFLLPLLERFSSKKARASGNSDPRRFVSLYMSNGTYNVKGDAVWYPQNLQTGPLTASMFSERSVFAPFTGQLGNFSIVMHPASTAALQAGLRFPETAGHSGPISTFLSQAVWTDPTSAQCTVPGSSFDQMVADAVNKPNLVMSGGCNDAAPDGVPFNYAEYVSFKNGQPNEPERNPVELYKKMFAALVPTPSAPIAAAARNHSILDSSLADIRDLQSKLGKTDNRKLDAYMTSVRNLETRIFTTPSSVAGCNPPGPPPETLDNVDQDGALSSVYNQRVQSFFDMIVLAFECDLVRSASFVYDGETCGRTNNPCPANLLYQGADLSGSLHIGISHYGVNPNGDIKCISRDRNYLNLFFYLIDKLKASVDPSGSPMLDNTIVLSGNPVGDGQHTANGEGWPLIVGGGRNFMHPGNCYDLQGSGWPLTYAPGTDMIDLLYTFSTFLNLGWSNFRGSSTLLKI